MQMRQQSLHSSLGFCQLHSIPTCIYLIALKHIVILLHSDVYISKSATFLQMSARIFTVRMTEKNWPNGTNNPPVQAPEE